tara:strand:+ start:3217 stop:3771 length:555 start_codon:yes stop_codon:yes gene_type:complete
MQENTDKIKAEYKELKKSKTSIIKSIVSRAYKVYDTKGTDKEGMISDILVAKYGSKKVKAAFNESIETNEIALVEALNVQQRMKLKQSMRRNKAKIAMGRKRAARKLASPEKLQKRAEKAARTAMVKKILKDKDKSDLSYAARKGIEDRLSKKKGQIKTMAKKLLKTVRIKDREKLQKNKPGAK